MRLIDADALIELHCEGCSKDVRDGCETDPVCATLMWLEDAPTIDAVPVVRCKDCKYWNKRYEAMGMCMKHNAILTFTKPDFYCAWGERKQK